MRSKLALIAALCLLLAPISAADEVIVLDTSIYRNDTVQVHAMDVGNGTVKSMFPDGDYSIRLLDADGNELYAEQFLLSFHTTYFRRGPGAEGSTSEPTTVERRSFRLPALPEATTLEISRENRSIFTASIPERVCNQDGFCASYCRYGDRMAMDPDCDEPVDTKNSGGISITRLLIGLMLLLLAVAVYMYWIRGNGDEEAQSPFRR